MFDQDQRGRAGLRKKTHKTNGTSECEASRQRVPKGCGAKEEQQSVRINMYIPSARWLHAAKAELVPLLLPSVVVKMKM